MRVLEITYLMVVPKQLRTQLPPLRRMRVILENILNGSYIICRTQLPPKTNLISGTLSVDFSYPPIIMKYIKRGFYELRYNIN